MNSFRNEKGGTLIFIVVAILIFGFFCGSMTSMFTSSTISVSTQDYALEARYMAEAGIRYARAVIRDAEDKDIAEGKDATSNWDSAIAAINITKTYTLNNGNGFEISIVDNTPVEITSIGFASAGSACSYMELQNTYNKADSGGDTGKDSEIVFRTNGDISIGGNSYVNGGINTEKSVSVGGSASLEGDINAGENVNISGAGSVDGNIISGGSVTISGSGIIISGDIDATGDIFLIGSADVGGNVTAGGNVELSGSANVSGNINAGGQVEIGGGGDVEQSIIAGDSVTLTPSANVDGSVDSGGDISLGWGCHIGGDATASGHVTYCSNNDIPIAGSILENTQAPPRLLPEDPEEYYVPTLQYPDTLFTAGELEPSSNSTLEPGKYGTLKANVADKFYFKAGKYYFQKIDAQAYGAAFYLDLSEVTEEKGIEIFVVSDASFGWGFELMISTDGTNYFNSKNVDTALAANIYLETRGAFNTSGQWFGAVYSWEKIDLNNTENTYVGLFYTKDASELSVNGQIILVPSNYIMNYWSEE